MGEFLDKNFYKLFLIGIWVVVILPLLAPIFAALNLTVISSAIYWLFSFSCHQLAHRSMHIDDHQVAWCMRDTFIWAGIALTTTLAPKFKLKNFKFYWLIPFVIPIALDGGIQTIATMLGFSGGDNFYTSTNFMRAVTGGIFGIGAGLFFYQMIYGINQTREEVTYKEGKNYKQYLKLVGCVFGILMVLYMLFIQIWGLTSHSFEPANALDLAVRTPADETAWQRQLNGTCKPQTPKVVNGSSLQEFIFTPADCF